MRVWPWRMSCVAALAIGGILALLVASEQYASSQPAQTGLPVRIKADSTGGSLDDATAAAVRTSLAPYVSGPSGVRLTQDGARYEVVRFTSRLAAILGPEGAVRKSVALSETGAFANASGARDIADALVAFAQQDRLVALAASGGAAGAPILRAIPAGGVDNCRGIAWSGGGWGESQTIPLCQTFRMEVRLPATARQTSDIHLLILSSGGAIVRQRLDGLAPGATSAAFRSARTGADGILRAAPPVNLPDVMLAFAVPAGNEIDWDAILSGTNVSTANPYTRDIARRLRGEAGQAPGWSVGALSVRAIASDIDAGKRTTPTGDVSLREYTIKGFDISPYLPADTNSALFKVLGQADWLASRSRTDGVPYKQHAWPGGDKSVNDVKNLKTGIDCSRSIWFAFTRAGLKYNRTDRYLATADMVTTNTWMKDEFEACPTTSSYRTGDILVYRDDVKGAGHVVMVIDAEQRIAWGSHGWDGNAKLMKTEPDTGVEYQVIKIKKDWERWDSANMTLRACWRSKTIAKEWVENPASRAGSTQIKSCQNMCPTPVAPRN